VQAKGDGEKGHARAPCHAPVSDDKYAELQDKVRESVDRAMELSRAALYRLVPKIFGDFTRFAATGRTETGA
jgi:hypothetical protein